MIHRIQNLTRKVSGWFTLFFDRAISGPPLKQLLVLFGSFTGIYLFWVLFGVLLFRGKDLEFINNELNSFSWGILAQMLDPGNLHMVGKKNIEALNGLRWFVFLVTLTGSIVFGGLLISTFSNIFDQRIEKVRSGRLNYRFYRHSCILGFNNQAPGLISHLLNNQTSGKIRVVILTEGDVQNVRNELLSGFTSRQLRNVFLLAGDRTSVIDLKRINVQHAREIYLLGENNEAEHDSRNNASLSLIDELCKENKKENTEKPYCTIVFDSQTTHSAYQFTDSTFKNLEIHSVNYYEQWAKTVFLSGEETSSGQSAPDSQSSEMTSERVFRYQPLDFEEITPDSDKQVHLIVAGGNRMGFALAAEAMRSGHFANFSRKKTKITLIDADADRDRDFFTSRYQSLFRAIGYSYSNTETGEKESMPGELPFINLEFAFLKGRLESQAVRDMLLSITADPSSLCTIAICLSNPDASLASGLFLPDEIYKRPVNILVRQDSVHSILAYIQPNQKKTEDKYKNVRVFGVKQGGIDWDSTRKFKAMAVNYFYFSDFSIPDTFSAENLITMKEYWDGLSERHKWSSRNNAESIPVKLRALRSLNMNQIQSAKQLRPEVVELLARIEHARWNADALLAGFYPPSAEVQAESTRTADILWDALLESGADFTNEKVKQLKWEHEQYVNQWKRRMIHPCIVHYDALSEYYKEIDRRLGRAIPVIESENKRLSRSSASQG